MKSINTYKCSIRIKNVFFLLLFRLFSRMFERLQKLPSGTRSLHFDWLRGKLRYTFKSVRWILNQLCQRLLKPLQHQCDYMHCRHPKIGMRCQFSIRWYTKANSVTFQRLRKKNEIWEIKFHNWITIYQRTFGVRTFIASSSVVSSPANITLTLSDQSSPNARCNINNAASPLFHCTGGLASTAMCAWFARKPYDSMICVARNL